MHDVAKADILAQGVKKSTADAMIQSLENITDVLGLKESSKNLARKVKAEAEITETKAKEIQKVNQHDDSTIVIDDLGGADNDGESQTSD